MTMKMNRAFNSRMLTRIVRYIESSGHYDADNFWVTGTHTITYIWGVIVAGNKFSQFDEGIARIAMESGERHSDYRKLYVQSKFPRLKDNDKIKYRDTYYNILQESDEEIFGFHSYIVEKPKNFIPNVI